jgi:hypothetical protein
MSIQLTTLPTPISAQAEIEADQVLTIQTLLTGEDLIKLPDGKSASDVIALSLSVRQNDGSGFLSVTIK